MTAVPSPTRGRSSLNRSRWAAPVGSVLVLVAFALLWWLFSTLLFVVPSPWASIDSLGTSLRQAAYIDDLRTTAVAVLWAFVLGAGIGAVLGVALGVSRVARTVFGPLVIGLNGLPKIVLYPLLLPFFHLDGAKVVMGVLFALFPVLINVEAGVRDMPAVYSKLGRSLRASRRQFLVHILLPAIRRPLLTGIRLAVSLATVGVVLSEFFATDKGLGRDILSASSQGRYAQMMGTIFLLIGTSFVLSLLLWRLERRYA